MNRKLFLGYMLVLFATAIVTLSCEKVAKGPVAVGFVYDSEDTLGVKGGALILDLFDNENIEHISPEDIITEYRGISVSSGNELDLLIDRLEEVPDGQILEMRILPQGNEPSKLVQVVAKKKAESGTKSTTYSNSSCHSSNGGKLCKCSDSGTLDCTITREWRRNPANAKKYQHRTKCTDGVNTCPWTLWLNGK